MNFIKMAVKRRVFVAMCFFCIVLLGGVSLSKIGLDLFPSIQMPISMVMTTYEGAGSEEVEQMVTKPLEAALGTLQGVDTIQSYSAIGMSMVMVQFNWGTDLNFAGIQMREKIDMYKAMLPDGAGTPTVMKMDPNMMPIMSISVTGSGNLAELKNLVETEIKPAIERQNGIASADLAGGYDKEIDVTIEPVTLEMYGLSMQSVVQSIQRDNSNMAAGEIITGGQQVTIRVLGKYKSLSDIEQVNVVLPTGGSVLLKDIAKIEMVQKSGTALAYLDDKESVILTVNKQSDANTANTCRDVANAIEKLKPSLPPNVEIFTVFSQGDMVQMTIDSLTSSLYTGAILAMAILFIFMKSFRSTLIIGVSIPISLIGTFVLMYFNGMTLNMMTLGGLALGVGMMVDSSIVILENIQRLRTNGLSGEEAAIKGASQLVMAVVASTLTTIAVFLPVVFTEGMTSILFKDLALTVTFSLVASLIVAITLVPMLSARILKPEGEFEDRYANGMKGVRGVNRVVYRIQNAFVNGFERFKARYVKILDWSLDHRKRVVTIIMGMFFGSFLLLAMIGMEFIPSSDSGTLEGYVYMSAGTPKEETYKTASKIQQIIKEEGGDSVVGTSIVIGGSSMGAMGGGDASTAEIVATLVPVDQRDFSSIELAERVRQRASDIAGAEIFLSGGDMMGSMGGGSGAAASVTISGENMDVLRSLAEQIKSTMESIPGARDAQSSLDDGLPEIHLTVDYNKASALGVSVPMIASTISGYLDGQTAAQFTDTGGNEIDIRVKLPEDKLKDMDNILSMPVSMGNSKLLLKDVVKVESGTGPVQISRVDQKRQITVSCSLVDTDLNTFTTSFNNKLEDIVLPQGYEISQGGNYQEMMDAFSSLTLAVVLGIILIYMVMASLFESLVQPFVIMFSIPTAFIGVFFGLFITGNTLNVTSFIGIVMLMGIVVNNGIVLVDSVNQMRRDEGITCREALRIAGSVRMRPIMMTALTTILAMVPMGFSASTGAELSRGMAVAIGFGLTFSTFFTLIFVPVIYTIFDAMSVKSRYNSARRKARLKARLTGGDVEVLLEQIMTERRFTDEEREIIEGLPKNRQEKKELKKRLKEERKASKAYGEKKRLFPRKDKGAGY